MPWSTPKRWPSVIAQHVPALAVGVVDDDVEDGHPAQRLGVLVHQRDRAVLRRRRRRARAGSRRAPAAAGPGRPATCSGSGSHHSCTMPSPAGPSRSTVGGTTAQPSASRHGVRRHLAPGQGAVGEVPQGPLPGDRLVDAGHRGVLRPDPADEGGVRRRQDPALDPDLPGEQGGPALGPGGVRAHRAVATRPGTVTPPASCAGTRWPAGTGGRPGRRDRRRTGRRAGRRRPRPRPAW